MFLRQSLQASGGVFIALFGVVGKLEPFLPMGTVAQGSLCLPLDGRLLEDSTHSLWFSLSTEPKQKLARLHPHLQEVFQTLLLLLLKVVP